MSERATRRVDFTTSENFPVLNWTVSAGVRFWARSELPDDPELLSRLDRYEEFDPQNPSGSLFVRKQVSISRLNRSRIIGWAYEYNGDISSSKVIKSGDYLKIAA